MRAGERPDSSHSQGQMPGSAASGGGTSDPVMLLLHDLSSCLVALEEKAG